MPSKKKGGKDRGQAAKGELEKGEGEGEGGCGVAIIDLAAGILLRSSLKLLDVGMGLSANEKAMRVEIRRVVGIATTQKIGWKTSHSELGN
jgi:hypothetical protein